MLSPQLEDDEMKEAFGVLDKASMSLLGKRSEHRALQERSESNNKQGGAGNEEASHDGVDEGLLNRRKELLASNPFSPAPIPSYDQEETPAKKRLETEATNTTQSAENRASLHPLRGKYPGPLHRSSDETQLEPEREDETADAEVREPRGDSATNATIDVDALGSPSTIKFGVSKTNGRKREMEDRHVAIPTVLPSQKQSPSLFAVFDGHAGAQSAEHAVKRFPALVRTALLSRLDDGQERQLQGTEAIEVLQESFEKLESELLQLAKESKIRDGSTALAALLFENHLFVGNLGDSRAVLVSKDESLRLSVDHKPDDEKERERIEESGGMVVMSGVWRVAHPRIPSRLAMSRSLGDAKFKQDLPKNVSAPLVSSRPTITSVELREGDRCVVLASDGIWDVVSDDEARHFVLECFGSTNDRREWKPTKAACEEAAKKLTKIALERGSIDNITCIVVALEV